MEKDALLAHSLAEAYLYLMANLCPACGEGGLESTEVQEVGPKTDRNLSLAVSCRTCLHTDKILFHLPFGTGESEQDAPPVFNPSEKPSRIIDLGQWLMLFRAITASAAQVQNKQESRRLGIEAALCLEEALKFYDPGNDLPPAEAFFSDRTRDHFRSNPQTFSRKRLLDLRHKLPSISHMQKRVNDPPRKKPWWRFGF